MSEIERAAGFFTDQRDNRMGIVPFARGKKVLDVCSYTGGFALYAKKLGGADEVTAVELDPDASSILKMNANANQVRIDAVTADAFPYLRQAGQNNKRYGLVILDPYKLIANQESWSLGRQKYIDLNRLGISLVEFPKRTPSLARGAELYRRECASCHGELGRGDGPAGKGLDPAPANLADHTALMDVTPLAFYQRITIGVAGNRSSMTSTASPSSARMFA